jgi:hypothetical protein
MRSGAWSLEFSADDGTRGRVALTIPPEGAARYEAVFAAPALGDGVFVVRDDDVPPPRAALLEVRADGLWAELVCETAGEHWSFGLEAFGLRVDDWDEAEHAEVGDRVAVGLDLEWEIDEGAPGTGLVHGELLTAHARSVVNGRGVFAERAGS